MKSGRTKPMVTRRPEMESSRLVSRGSTATQSASALWKVDGPAQVLRLGGLDEALRESFFQVDRPAVGGEGAGLREERRCEGRGGDPRGFRWFQAW